MAIINYNSMYTLLYRTLERNSQQKGTSGTMGMAQWARALAVESKILDSPCEPCGGKRKPIPAHFLLIFMYVTLS